MNLIVSRYLGAMKQFQSVTRAFLAGLSGASDGRSTIADKLDNESCSVGLSRARCA